MTSNGLMHSSRALVSVREPGARIFRAHQVIQIRQVVGMPQRSAGTSGPHGRSGGWPDR